MSFFAIYPALGGSGGGSGITSINGDTTASQTIAAGTGISVVSAGGTTTITNSSPNTFTPGNLTDAGTDGIVITGGTNAVNGAGTSIAQHVADSTHNGYLSSTDWSTFNNKQSTLTLGNLTDAGTDGITVTGGTGAVVGSGTSIAQHVSDSTHNGYLSSADWSTFNGKQNALTFGNFTDVGTDGITVTGGTGSVIGSGTSIAQHVADSTHNGYLSSTDWSTFNNKGSGTVTSVDVSGGTTGLTFTGGPITTTGTITAAGTLAIANGGTNGTTATSGFDNLSPTTTDGDLIFNNGTNNVRLPIGSTGQVLTVVAGEPAWATGPGALGFSDGFSAGVTAGASGTFTTAVSLSLAAGTWDVSGTVYLDGFTTNVNAIGCAISLTNNAADSGRGDAQNLLNVVTATLVSPTSLVTPTRRLVLGSTTTVYLVGYVTYGGGAPTWTVDSYIRATQIS
jgi:hypothetical protein